MEIEEVFADSTGLSNRIHEDVVQRQSEQLWNSFYEGQLVMWQGVVVKESNSRKRIVLGLLLVVTVVFAVIWLLGTIMAQRGVLHEYCFGLPALEFHLLMAVIGIILAILWPAAASMYERQPVTVAVSVKPGTNDLRNVHLYFDKEFRAKTREIPVDSIITFCGILHGNPYSKQEMTSSKAHLLALKECKLEDSHVVVSPEARYARLRQIYYLPDKVREARWKAYYSGRPVQFRGRITGIDETSADRLVLTADDRGLILIISLTNKTESVKKAGKLSIGTDGLFLGRLPLVLPRPSEPLKISGSEVR